MPEQLMCPMRSDAKTVRHCEPDKCMWGRYYDHGRTRTWVCSASVASDFYEQVIERNMDKGGQ